VISLASWTNLSAIRDVAVGLVSRLPARVQTKLLAAFLAMVVLLIVLGAVGQRVLSAANQRTEELIILEHKIAAYRQVQHDTTSQLYGVTAALLLSDERGWTLRFASSISSGTTWTACSSWQRMKWSCSAGSAGNMIGSRMS